MNAELLCEGARIFGLDPGATEIEHFSLYLAELQRWNRSINLTAIHKADQIVIKHFIDSLSLVPLLEKGERLLDVGSGAGLPGLALAIMRKDLLVTSIDAVDKKVRFQRHLVRLLKLDQVTVLHERVEQLAKDQPGAYDVITSRAFRDIGRFARLVLQLLRPGGRIVAMVSGEACEVPDEVSELGLEHLQTIRYELPHGMGSRALLVFRRRLV